MRSRSRQRETIAALRQQLLAWEYADRPPFSTSLEAMLRQGLRRGILAEYLADDGSGATALALIAAREACREGQALVVIERQRRFYPPAAANFGIWATSIVVRTRSQKDELWALNQSLRCPGVGAVVSWPTRLDHRAFRTLQLSAEAGGTVGLLIRPVSALRRPTWAEMQFLVQTLPGAVASRRLRIEIVRCRRGNAGASLEVDLDDETGTIQAARDVRMASELVPAKAGGGTRGA